MSAIDVNTGGPVRKKSLVLVPIQNVDHLIGINQER